MKKSLIGTTVLALALLSACSGEGAKEVEKDVAPVEVTDKTSTTDDSATIDETATVGIVGLEGLTEEQVSAAEKAVNTILLNMDSAQAEDMELYLTTVSKELAEASKATMEPVFAELDLAYKIIGDIEVVKVAEDLSEIVVKATQDTLKTDVTAAFNDNRLTATHTLTLDDEGNYRISATEVDPASIEYLGDMSGVVKDKLDEAVKSVDGAVDGVLEEVLGTEESTKTDNN